MLQVLAGYDPEEPSSLNMPVPDYAAELTRPQALKTGVPRPYFYESLNPEVQAAVEAALLVLKRLTSSEHEIEIPASGDPTVLRVEALAYHQEFIAKSPELYQPETLKRIRGGSGITGATYVTKRRELDQLRHSIRKTFETVDVIVTPTSPVPPFTIAELLSDPETLRTKELLTLRNTRPFNTLGLPTISLPCGFTSAGLPVGLQLSGPPGGEATVLRLARAYERETEWHTRRPSLG
jgi:Asp-tRNA(Asn)/Glu-tRNA(Gln) amidotransferase A subunit family amidase